jgi:hypothetical protein
VPEDQLVGLLENSEVKGKPELALAIVSLVKGAAFLAKVAAMSTTKDEIRRASLQALAEEWSDDATAELAQLLGREDNDLVCAVLEALSSGPPRPWPGPQLVDAIRQRVRQGSLETRRRRCRPLGR